MHQSNVCHTPLHSNVLIRLRRQNKCCECILLHRVTVLAVNLLLIRLSDIRANFCTGDEFEPKYTQFFEFRRENRQISVFCHRGTPLYCGLQSYRDRYKIQYFLLTSQCLSLLEAKKKTWWLWMIRVNFLHPMMNRSIQEHCRLEVW